MKAIIDCGVRISEEKDYCYKMWRRWNKDKKNDCIFILLHSPQILHDQEPVMLKKCQNITRKIDDEKYGGCIAVSLFAYIARVPCDVIGNPTRGKYQENEEQIEEVIKNAGDNHIIVAWGDCENNMNGSPLSDYSVLERIKEREDMVKRLLLKHNKKAFHRGMTRNGHPISPRLKNINLPLQPYSLK